MIRGVPDLVWAFDCEWVPDPAAGRLLYALPEAVSDAEVMQRMWVEGGADERDPRPFLKIALCRIVSIAAVQRRVQGSGVTLTLLSLPHDPDDPEDAREANVVGRFLRAVGDRKPQLVGYNHLNADIRILLQRGVILGIQAAAFCKRPPKPWDGPDYFARASEANVDLQDVLGGFGRATPSLHQMAVLSGIPGKMDVDGNAVADLWLAGERRRIVAYNEFDALTTYLVWLRLAHFAGHLNADQYGEEQRRVRALIESESCKPGREHLATYLSEWDRLRRATGQEPSRGGS
jgi:predicted PolB exonuclease-like 3'-5' exonuclease